MAIRVGTGQKYLTWVILSMSWSNHPSFIKICDFPPSMFLCGVYDRSVKVLRSFAEGALNDALLAHIWHFHHHALKVLGQVRIM